MSAVKRPVIIVKRKKGKGHGHHGGAWKVAYADFVTAMMALFMVMWLLASTDAKSRKEIANYFRSGVLPEGDLSMGRASQVAPAIIEETGAPNPSPRRLAEDAAEEIRKAVEEFAAQDPVIAEIERQVNVEVRDDGVLIEAVDRDGGASLLFDVASADLKPALQALLARLGPQLSGMDGVVEVIGHTDARPFADGRMDNWTLSHRRADAARRVLVAAGLPSDRMYGVTARAATQPRNAGDPFAAENRRLGILLRPRSAPAAAAPAPQALPAADEPR